MGREALRGLGQGRLALAERARGIGPASLPGGSARALLRLVPGPHRSRLGRLLQDHVGVGAADAEGGDAGAARARRSASHSTCSLSSSISPASQSTLEEGASTCRVLGRTPSPHRLGHLDHAGDSGCRLGVADVGLDRAELQRPLPVLAVGGEQGSRPRSGRRGWCRCRGPRPRRRPLARGGRWPAPGGSPAPGRGRWGR